MSRRNFIIIDDMPDLGEKVEKAIKHYYSSRNIYDYDIKTFLLENHFTLAKDYIQKYYESIDVMFSDQNLRGGKGIELFKTADIIIPTEFTSIQKHSHVYRVMHSDTDERLKQTQKEYHFFYDFFVNSESGTDIYGFLDFYEINILEVKEKGSLKYLNYLYARPVLKKLLEQESITIDRNNVKFRDILFLVMDKERGNSEYYHFYYKNGDEVVESLESKKPDSKFNQAIAKLLFCPGILKDGSKEKFKVNPLWIVDVDSRTNIIKLFPHNSIRYEIQFEKLDNNPSQFLTDGLDEYFI
jgi:hypothetical protein